MKLSVSSLSPKTIYRFTMSQRNFKMVLHLVILISNCQSFGLKLFKDDLISKHECSDNSYKLLSLLNLLCNTTQTTSIITRDACYGCFFRAGNLNPGPTQLQQLQQCATLYLNNTNYGVCINSLQQPQTGVVITSPLSGLPQSQCFSGHCGFVRCVRLINTNSLISRCFDASINLLNSNRIQFYINTTRCILRSIKCNQYNPITGEYQPNTQQHQNAYLSNSIQINENGEIRIISFPINIRVNQVFCSTYSAIPSNDIGLC